MCREEPGTHEQGPSCRTAGVVDNIYSAVVLANRSVASCSGDTQHYISTNSTVHTKQFEVFVSMLYRRDMEILSREKSMLEGGAGDGAPAQVNTRIFSSVSIIVGNLPGVLLFRKPSLPVDLSG